MFKDVSELDEQFKFAKLIIRLLQNHRDVVEQYEWILLDRDLWNPQDKYIKGFCEVYGLTLSFDIRLPFNQLYEGFRRRVDALLIE